MYKYLKKKQKKYTCEIIWQHNLQIKKHLRKGILEGLISDKALHL